MPGIEGPTEVPTPDQEHALIVLRTLRSAHRRPEDLIKERRRKNTNGEDFGLEREWIKSDPKEEAFDRSSQTGVVKPRKGFVLGPVNDSSAEANRVLFVEELLGIFPNDVAPEIGVLDEDGGIHASRLELARRRHVKGVHRCRD